MRENRMSNTQESSMLVRGPLGSISRPSQQLQLARHQSWPPVLFSAAYFDFRDLSNTLGFRGYKIWFFPFAYFLPDNLNLISSLNAEERISLTQPLPFASCLLRVYVIRKAFYRFFSTMSSELNLIDIYYLRIGNMHNAERVSCRAVSRISEGTIIYIHLDVLSFHTTRLP